MEIGQDVALISFCMCGLNAVDIFNAQKEQYVNGIFHYERQKTKNSRADRGYFEVRVREFLKPTFEKYLSKQIHHGFLTFIIVCLLPILSVQMLILALGRYGRKSILI